MSLLASFEWSFIWDNRDEFLHGLWKTLQVSLIAIAGAFAVGVVLGAGRAHRIPVLSQLAAIYVEVIRNTPILVQVYFVYFGLSEPPFNIRLTAFTAGWLTLVVWGGAFNTENFRAGFEAVPYRYREAGLALGFGRLKTLLHVTLPPGGRIVLGTLLTIRFLPLRGLIRLYIEVWRGLPLIVTLFLIVYALPQTTFHLTFRPWVGAAIGLTLWGSAQVAEATRGAVESIPREQHEAASALGLGWGGRHVHVVLPQALRRLLPPPVSLRVNVIQNTTLAALVSVTEVLFAAKQQVERLAAPPPAGLLQQHGFAIYAAVLVFFFVVSFQLLRLAALLQCWLILSG